MFYEFQSRLILQGTLTATTAIRIGSGRNPDVTGTDLPVIKDALNRPFVPGSTFKGVLRSRIESLLRAVAPPADTGKWACNPLNDSERCIPPAAIDAEKRRLRRQQPDEARRDRDLDGWVRDETCLACQLFGSPWLASRVQVRDWQVDENTWFDQFMVRDGVAIDRDTETAAEQLLYSYEVVPAGTRFQGTLLVDNAEEWMLGLLFAGLREFEQHLPLGGATSRGLGGVHLEWVWEKSRYLGREDLWAYLENTQAAGSSPQAKMPAWQQAMLAKLRDLGSKEDADVQANHQ